jgi:hypothetical protein
MDMTAITGWAAAASAILVFCGSVWLLLAMVLGARLSYFVTASVTLAFVLIMGVVWSINILGPVGQLPSWEEQAIGEDVSEFGYPEGDWAPPNEDDEKETALASEFEGDATDYLERSIDEGAEGVNFTNILEAEIDEEATQLVEVDGDTFGATLFTPIEDLELEGGQAAPDPVVVVMAYDPGSPLEQGRLVAIGSFILLVLHLFGLSRAEKKAKERPGAEV